MSKCNVYDENVYVDINRHGTAMTVHFWELLKGDVITTGAHKGLVVAEDAHKSEDPDYEGWLFHSLSDEGYFPEDFGAKLITCYSEEEEVQEKNTVFVVTSNTYLNLYRDIKGRNPPAYVKIVAIFDDENDAKVKVNELSLKDKELVKRFGCDPTYYEYKEYEVF